MNASGEGAMAMTMNGEVQLAAPRAVVWEKLNDAAVLKQCIPGCQELETTCRTEMPAVATFKVGPVKASFGGKVHACPISIRRTAIASPARARAASPVSPRAARWSS